MVVGGLVTLEDLERAHILKVLEALGGHKKRAAEVLAINPSTLYRKLLRYGVGGLEDEDEADAYVEAVTSFETAAADDEVLVTD